jgi:hypothetical protein
MGEGHKEERDRGRKKHWGIAYSDYVSLLNPKSAR